MHATFLSGWLFLYTKLKKSYKIEFETIFCEFEINTYAYLFTIDYSMEAPQI